MRLKTAVSAIRFFPPTLLGASGTGSGPVHEIAGLALAVAAVAMFVLRRTRLALRILNVTVVVVSVQLLPSEFFRHSHVSQLKDRAMCNHLQPPAKITQQVL